MPDLTSTPFYEKLLAMARSPAETPAPRASVAVIPWRRTPAGGLEVYWVRRAPTMRFMGGWYAFPGGGVSRRDAAVPVAGEPRATAAGRVTDPLPGLDDAARARLGPDLAAGVVAAGLRELFEETGLLVTDPDHAPAPETLAAPRRRLLAKEADFAALAAEEGWRLTAAPLVFAGRWLTPPVAPMRLIFTALVCAVAAFGAIKVFGHVEAPKIELTAGFGSIEGVGRLMLSDFLYPFEVISLILLVAVVGVVLLAKKVI